ncbi:MAG: CapA family protein [Lachnospiraceae bacterium]|nr:CapA family protein [Lachnospiraceae bacterium]
MKKKRGKKKLNFIIPFCVTLVFVILTGLFVMFSYLWIVEDANPGAANTQLIKEDILRLDEALEFERELVGNPEKEDEENENIKDINPERGEEYMLEENVFVKGAASEDCITITFAGDILFDSGYAIMSTLLQRGGDISSGIAPELIEEMKNSDIMMVNNEFPYSDRGEPTPEKQFTFRAKPSSVSYLQDLGVDIVSLANNHAYDYGEEALIDTLQVLKDAEIHYVGAGIDASEASRPFYYIVNDMKIAFISATQVERNDNPDTKEATDTSPGVFRCWNGENLLQTVRETKENSDFVIVYVHWGTENEEEIDWAQDKQSRELVEAGADLIVGDHPHILQKVDIINGVPVFYSMGNFWFNSRTMDTGLLKVTISDKELKSCQFLPCLQNNCKTTLLTGTEKDRVLDIMRTMSENVNIDADGYCLFK